jgi:phenylacetic acid degradation protein
MPSYSIDGIVPVVDLAAFVHDTAVLIGDVHIGPGCYVGPGASIRGDFGRIVLEKGSNLQDNCIMHGYPGPDTVIREGGHVGHGAVLHGCVIGRDALIGMNSVVMDGAVIGESAFVAAMCFVKAGFDVPARSLVAGVPGKVLRELSDEEIAWKREGTLDYQELTRRCLATLQEVAPLEAPEPDRPKLAVGVAAPLYATKKKLEP